VYKCHLTHTHTDRQHNDVIDAVVLGGATAVRGKTIAETCPARIISCACDTPRNYYSNVAVKESE